MGLLDAAAEQQQLQPQLHGATCSEASCSGLCLHGRHDRPARIERGCIDVPSRLFLELPRAAAQPHPLLASSAQLHLLSSWTWSSKQKPKRKAITAKRTAHVENGF
jgi:hypothetical protein